MWTSEVLSSDRQPRTEPRVSGAHYPTSVPLVSGLRSVARGRKRPEPRWGSGIPIWVLLFDSITPWFRCLCGRPNRVQYRGCKRCLSCGRISGVSETNMPISPGWRSAWTCRNANSPGNLSVDRRRWFNRIDAAKNRLRLVLGPVCGSKNEEPRKPSGRDAIIASRSLVSGSCRSR